MSKVLYSCYIFASVFLSPLTQLTFIFCFGKRTLKDYIIYAFYVHLAKVHVGKLQNNPTEQVYLLLLMCF